MLSKHEMHETPQHQQKYSYDSGKNSTYRDKRLTSITHAGWIGQADLKKDTAFYLTCLAYFVNFVLYTESLVTDPSCIPTEARSKSFRQP